MFYFRWVSTFTGTICFILFLPGIFVEHKDAGNAQPTKGDEKKLSTSKGLSPPDSDGKDAPNGFGKERKRSYVVPMVPKEVLMLRKIEATKPKAPMANRQLLKQFSTISVLDGVRYAAFADDDDEEEEANRQLSSKPSESDQLDHFTRHILCEVASSRFPERPNSAVVFVACWAFFGAFCSFVVMEA